MVAKKIAAQKTETKAVRNVEEDLIGTPPAKIAKEKTATNKKLGKVIEKQIKETKKAVKADKKTESNGKVGRPSQYKPGMSIRVLKEKECREGTTAEACWKMVKQSKTVGDYLKKREKAKMEGFGGYFNAFVNDKYIAVK